MRSGKSWWVGAWSGSSFSTHIAISSPVFVLLQKHQYARNFFLYACSLCLSVCVLSLITLLSCSLALFSTSILHLDVLLLLKLQYARSFFLFVCSVCVSVCVLPVLHSLAEPCHALRVPSLSHKLAVLLVFSRTDDGPQVLTQPNEERGEMQGRLADPNERKECSTCSCSYSHVIGRACARLAKVGHSYSSCVYACANKPVNSHVGH